MGSEPTGATDSAREDRDYVAEVERGERVARWGLAVSGVVAALIAGAVVLAAGPRRDGRRRTGLRGPVAVPVRPGP